jgi:hypothetical protein
VSWGRDTALDRLQSRRGRLSDRVGAVSVRAESVYELVSVLTILRRRWTGESTRTASGRRRQG